MEKNQMLEKDFKEVFKKKQNTNPVGTGLNTSTIEGISQNKGITLIALIITIIVMLILAGVTINVTLNGGIFTKASDASKQMQIEAEKEELLSAVVAAIGNDGKVVLGDLELPTGWTGTNGTYTSPKGNTFVVDGNGKIEEKNNLGGGSQVIPLTQIKTGDIWTNVTFASTTLSNEGIETPLKGVTVTSTSDWSKEKEVDLSRDYIPIAQSNYINCQIDYVVDSIDNPDFLQVEMNDGSVYMCCFWNEPYYLDDLDHTFIPGQIYKIDTTGTVTPLEEEELTNISFTGTIYACYKENVDGEEREVFFKMPEQIAKWFTASYGRVEYVDRFEYLD